VFNADANNYLAVNRKGCVEIKNANISGYNITFDDLKMVDLPEDV